MARLRGTAMHMAMRVETRVPTMLLAAPNSWSTGFHSWEKKKPKPNCLTAGQEERTNSSPMASITRGTSSEQKKVSQRKVRSPPAEVLTLRPLTTVRDGGDTSFGLFGWAGLSIMGFQITGKRGGLTAPASLGCFYLGLVKARGVCRRISLP